MVYTALKKIIKALVPGKLLLQHEAIFRSLVYLFFKGNRYHCNLCGKKLRRFVCINEEKLCPYCGSLPRTRRLWEILNRDYLRQDQAILDFSPSRSMRKAFRAIPGVNYVSTDLSGEFPADQHYDVTHLEVESNSFDLVLCYHILEHVENDRLAMQELYRVMKKGGTCLIQTPFKPGLIDEDASVRSEAERRIRFGQKDHVRIYSAEGLKDRLEDCGFQVSMKEFTAPEDHPVGYKTREIVLLCVK